MKVYIKFISTIFFKSLFFVFFVIASLVFILNLLSELEFFKNENVSINFTLFLSLLNTPSLLFEIFPFIILISVQLFFIKIFENKEIDIFKYSGLKNLNIINILISLTAITGIFIVIIFYNLSSNLKNFYLDLKSNYMNDGKHLAVITKNGLWIKDRFNNKTILINSSFIEGDYLVNNYITEFNENFDVIRNIQSDKINIKNNEWIIFKPTIYKKNNYIKKNTINLETNFNSDRIKNLYSNMSALNILELVELRKNYRKLNYSLIDIDLHSLKIISYPLFLILISLFSSLIMLNTKKIKNTTLKIIIGLFFSVIIYYLNNFFYVLGSTERISILISVFLPLVILAMINALMLYKIDEK